jgi:MSHA pilin protein MshD
MLKKSKQSQGTNCSVQQGFTLIEIIVGLVITGIAISGMATLIYPLFSRSVEPIFHMRAAEFAQALADDALAKPYDEATPLGGVPQCSVCTPSAALGEDTGETSRADFNDFDDYDLFCDTSPVPIQDVFGNNLTTNADYAGYFFNSCVVYDGNYDGGVDDGNIAAKRMDITVQPPLPAEPISFSIYRANY